MGSRAVRVCLQIVLALSVLEKNLLHCWVLILLLPGLAVFRSLYGTIKIFFTLVRVIGYEVQKADGVELRSDEEKKKFLFTNVFSF